MSDAQPDRDPIDQIAEEFALRVRSGEQPTVEEYAERYPQAAEKIRELLPFVEQIEQSKLLKESDEGICNAGLGPGRRIDTR